MNDSRTEQNERVPKFNDGQGFFAGSEEEGHVMVLPRVPSVERGNGTTNEHSSTFSDDAPEGSIERATTGDNQ